MFPCRRSTARTSSARILVRGRALPPCACRAASTQHSACNRAAAARTAARAYTREQHLDGRDLDGALIELVAPAAPLQERVYFQDHPSPLAPQQLMRVILMVLKAVEALEQPLVARQVEPVVKK